MTNQTFFNTIYLNDYIDDANFENRLCKVQNELKELPFLAKRRALDLGAGPGVYSFALSNLGFNEVVAIDYSQKLLDLILERKTPSHNIEIINADLHKLDELSLGEFDFINITGDTVLYLNEKKHIKDLLEVVFSLLKDHGIFYIQFRDFSKEEELLDRFKVTNQSDNYNKIISMNYDKDFIFTVDLVNRKVDGEWIFEKGMNKKIRISKIEMKNILQDVGFDIVMLADDHENIKLLCSKKDKGND